ncbi:hypothetical protein DL89DRAFT_263804 [Linderina pennispora]|uniref:NAD(P)-binding protein n=1 Tax=Linderina pennispora TaxID=61395 RepID=A0A1Y1WJN2_9FUNG|nr:uncharacterized protein DL89DRAFT_263804 [Linderina pennispora]ORX73790.1 hypothetical protein DL89DRAFT_263804 [Linderina pennispora]
METSAVEAISDAYIKYQSFNSLWIIMMLYGSVAGNFDKFGAGKGFWAVVTGSLGSLEKRGVMARSYAVDFSRCTEKQWADIGELVNSEQSEHSKINISTMMNMTRLIVPQLRERKTGLILNMGSFAALRSLPFLSVYAGTKGFVKTMLEPDGITVSHVFSFWVTSKMSGFRNPTLSVPTPETYVQCTFDRLGLRCGATDSFTTIPYWPHSILNFIVSCLWDPRHAPPVQYNIGNNLYQLGLLRQERRRIRHAERKKALEEQQAKAAQGTAVAQAA